MTMNNRNTDGPALPSSMDDLGAVYPPGESLEEKYQTALLMAAVLLEAKPHIDVQAWLRWRHAQGN